MRDSEVFGLVATLMPVTWHAWSASLAHRGQGSLVCSIYGDDDQALAATAIDLVQQPRPRARGYARLSPGRATGHGNMLPSPCTGGPSRGGRLPNSAAAGTGFLLIAKRQH